jgi:hypothetical protein
MRFVSYKELKMVYSNKFVMCVLVNGTPQSELANGVVKLPFGAEYSLRFRNKNNRRAVVKFFIDGENVSGEGYVVPANDYVDIKRHHGKDSSFKFVSLESAEAIDHGKNGPNPDKVKGTIEARFYFEKEQPKYHYTKEIVHHHHHYPRPPIRPNYPVWNGAADSFYLNTAGGSSLESNVSVNLDMSATKSMGNTESARRPRDIRRSRACGQSCDNQVTTQSQFTEPVLKDGCTVEGNYTGQTFHTVNIELEDTYTTLQVFLQGYEPEIQAAAYTKPHVINEGVSSLEEENERLRKEIAELENIELKKKLENLNKKRSRKPKA